MLLGMKTDKQSLDKSERIAPREVAKILGVSTRTVSRMADAGELHAIPLPSGHRRYVRAEIEALAQPEAQR